MKKLIREQVQKLIKEQEAIENASNPSCAQDNLWIFGNLQVPGFDGYYNVPTINTVCTSLCVTGTSFDANEEEMEHTCGCCEEEFNIIRPVTAASPTPDNWWDKLDGREKDKIMKNNM